MEKNRDLSPKEKAIYEAIIELFSQGADLSTLTVAEITAKAGIGKGTAYEYFSDKEEMIAKAIFYHVEQFCHILYSDMKQRNGLNDKINYALQIVEKEMQECNCVFRLIHAMTDNSMLGKRMQEFEEAQTIHGFIIKDIVRQMIIDECGENKVPSEEKVEYLVMTLLSKVVCYSMMLRKSNLQEENQRLMLRQMVCDGICREFNEIIGWEWDAKYSDFSMVTNKNN